jgi:hypothetical protein
VSVRVSWMLFARISWDVFAACKLFTEALCPLVDSRQNAFHLILDGFL